MDYIYHVGNLAVDRVYDGDLDTRATRLERAAKDGKVVLYQTRCYVGFQYHCRPVRGA